MNAIEFQYISKKTKQRHILNKEIKKDLLEEGIQLLEEWVKRRNLLPNGTQLVVSMTIRDVEPVILQIEDQRSSSKVDEILARPLKDLQ
mgnify:FL=1